MITVPAKSAADSVKSVADLPVNTLNELYACKYFHIYKIDVSGKMTFEQNAPFMNMTVTDGNGIVNGQPVKKRRSFHTSKWLRKRGIAGQNADHCLHDINQKPLIITACTVG